jgi:O-antigen/teichoic acid export membrane protein
VSTGRECSGCTGKKDWHSRGLVPSADAGSLEGRLQQHQAPQQPEQPAPCSLPSRWALHPNPKSVQQLAELLNQNWGRDQNQQDRANNRIKYWGFRSIAHLHQVDYARHEPCHSQVSSHSLRTELFSRPKEAGFDAIGAQEVVPSLATDIRSRDPRASTILMLAPELLLSRRTLSRNVGWSLVGQITPAIVGVIATPTIIRGFGDERFGLLTLVWMVIGYLSLFDLGLGRAVTKLAAERLAGPARSELREFVWTAWFLMAALGVIFALLPLFWIDQIVSHGIKTSVGIQKEASTSLRILLVSVPALVLMTGFRGFLEAAQRFGLVNAVRIPFGLCTYLVPLAVLHFTTNLAVVVAGLAAVRILATIAYALMCIPILGPDAYPTRPTRTAALRLVSFGAWLTVSNIIGPIMVTFDRFVVGGLISVAMVTYYATPFQIASQLLIVPAAVATVLFPAFATAYMHDRERVARIFSTGMKVVFFVIYPVAIVCIAFAPEILRFWIGGRFPAISTNPMRWILAGIVFNGMAQLPFALIQSAGRSDVTGKIHIVELPVYLASLFFVAARYGIDGVAFVWFLRSAIDFLALLLFARRWVRISVPSGLLAGVTAVVLFPLVLVFVSPPPIGRLVLLTAFGLLFGWQAWRKGLTSAERASFRSFTRLA